MGLYDQYLSMVQRALDNQLASQQAIYANRPQSKLSSFLTGFQGGMSQARMDKESKAKAEREQAKFDLEQRRLQAELDRFGWQQRQAEEESRLALEDRPFSLREREAKTKMLEAQTESMLRPKPEGPPSIEFFRGGMGMRWDPQSNAYVPATDAQGRPLYKYEPPRAEGGGGSGGKWVALATEPGELQRFFNTATAQVIESDARTKYKDIPPTVKKEMASHGAKMAELDDVISTASSNKSAFGAEHYWLPESISQRLDPDGVEARGRVQKVSAEIIHELTGAAQTADEVRRLRGFLPATGDTPGAIDTKLRGLKREYERYIKELDEQYSKEYGYKGKRDSSAPPPASGSSKLDALLGKKKSLPPDVQSKVDLLKSRGAPQKVIDDALKTMGY